METAVRTRVLFFAVLALVITFTSACATGGTAQEFIPPPDFSFLGIWEGSFTNHPWGTVFPQTMILEEQRDGEVRGRYISYRGNEIAGGIRGKVKLPKITFTLLGKDFTLILTSENTMEGWTWDSPGGGVPGQFFFQRKPQ